MDKNTLIVQLVTIVTGAVIRYFELRAIKKRHAQELQDATNNQTNPTNENQSNQESNQESSQETGTK